MHRWISQRVHWPAATLMAAIAVITLVGCGGIPAATLAQPTATPTTAQRVAALAQNAIGKLAHPVTASFNTTEEAATVTATVAWISDVATAQEQVKVVCFRAQVALWTSGVPLRKVTVVVQGPLIDLYADRTTGPYGSAVLTSSTAAKLGWSHLTADSAWMAYDYVFLRSAFNDAG